MKKYILILILIFAGLISYSLAAFANIYVFNISIYKVFFEEVIKIIMMYLIIKYVDYNILLYLIPISIFILIENIYYLTLNPTTSIFNRILYSQLFHIISILVYILILKFFVMKSRRYKILGISISFVLLSAYHYTINNLTLTSVIIALISLLNILIFIFLIFLIRKKTIIKELSND